jgi:hypothetical protein
MSADDAIKAFEDGSMHNLPPETLREMLRFSTQISAHNPNMAHKMTQSAELIRELLRAHDFAQHQARASEEAQSHHAASFNLGSKTLCWTKVAAIAAILGAGAALCPLIRPFISRPASSDSSPQATLPKSESSSPDPTLSTPAPPATTPSATGTPSPTAP